MNVKIFIGSSKEGKPVADAIDAILRRSTDSTPWSACAFELSDTPMETLMREVRDSDFAIFVFTPDDTVEKRGEPMQAPRDNVIYELGMFTGALGPKRCFVIVPDGTKLHLPSDLLGMTYGTYNPRRRDGNLGAAVNNFCSEVLKKVEKLSFRHGDDHARLRDLAITYECTDFINNTESRVERKQKLFKEMTAFCKRHPVNKRLLLAEQKTSFYFALCAAVVATPEASDGELILSADRKLFVGGESRAKAVDAMHALKNAKFLTSDQIEELAAWANSFENQDPSLRSWIDQFRM